ncbi:MAG: restriction endonuclease subunit S [Ruminococcus flavefaciens]|nr:restriction endonuclease subunit S [Ruminococcus flavefaciens]
MANLKDSGTEWLGKIPESWGLSRIGSVYELRNTKVSDKDYPPLSVTNKGIVPQLETAAKTNAHDDRKLVKKGDFAINSRSDRRGSCGISSYEGSVSLINTILAPLGEMNPRYYDWLFHTLQFSDEFYKWGHGIVDDLWTTNWQDMKKITIPMPALDEQEKIAAFLDIKCSGIDALTKDIQAEIDILEEYKYSIITEKVTKGLCPNVEMKDSGIEWVGKCPVHWRIVANKYVMEKVKYIKAVYENEDILSLTVKGVIVRDLDAGGKMPTSFNGYQILYPNNLLMCLFDYDVTPRCIGLIKNYGLSSPAYSQFAMKNQNYEGYYYYYYLMLDNTKELLHLAKNLRHSFTEEQLGGIHTLVPPIEEQHKIADYLDNKCTEIDSMIETKKEQLTVLDEYKKSVIYEYVTGKKEVTI